MCQQSKWSCYYWPGSITIPLLACSLHCEAGILSFFLLKKKLLWSYTPLLLLHIYFLTFSLSAHKEDSWSHCEQPLCTATHPLSFIASALHVKHISPLKAGLLLSCAQLSASIFHTQGTIDFASTNLWKKGLFPLPIKPSNLWQHSCLQSLVMQSYLVLTVNSGCIFNQLLFLIICWDNYLNSSLK